MVDTISMKYALLALLMVYTGCGRSLEHLGEFQGYAQRYQDAANARGKSASFDNITVGFGSIPDDDGSGWVIGICNFWTRGDVIVRGEVTLDPRYWATASPENREIVLFHEFGHCVNGLDHDDSEPLIMNTYMDMLTGTMYGARRDFYLDKHFAKAP